MPVLDKNVNTLKGVGPKKAEALSDLGITSIFDLLTYFPFRYQDFRTQDLNDVEDQQVVTLKGRVLNVPTVNYFGRRRNRLSFKLEIGKQVIQVTFFNQPWLKKQIEAGETIMVYGKYDQNRESLTGMKVLKPGTDKQFGSIYPTNHKISQNTIRELVKQAYSEYHEEIADPIPDWVKEKYRLCSLPYVIKNMHFPASKEDAEKARRTAKFDEFFLFQMRLQTLKYKKAENKEAQLEFDRKKIDAFISRLPYELTDAQKRVVGEILEDLNRPQEMNRLLQGDVGSGKTVVSAIVILATILSGKQAVILAPTEILAEQHANNLADIFKGTPVNISLLTGDTPRTAREQMLPRIENGEINLVVGTHALFQKSVKYHNLGLAVIDEQHRFGVAQRQKMRQKGNGTNVLSMTATPIPRTLSLTAYGQMDVSVIDELPKNRKPIKTAWINSGQKDSMIRFLKKRIKNGEQAYVVVPLIGESEAIDMANVQDTFDSLKKELGNDIKIGLLHGQMSDEEKNETMNQFQRNQISVLVSTTVVEVGVDVKNASVMVIYDADHFGLSQLHQLRGRVGRSDQQSYCLLIADPKNKTAKQRMKVMCDSNDGFFISEKDLELRGPGDILGKNQSGLPDFKVGDPVADLNILSAAQKTAKQIVEQNDWQTRPENGILKEQLQALEKKTSFD